MLKGKLALAAASTCLSLVAGECIVRVYLHRTEGGFKQLARQEPSAPSDAPLFSDLPMVHPYFGFTTRPGTSAFDGPSTFRLSGLREMHPFNAEWETIRANNHGFYSAFDYPYNAEGPSDYTIGVFGGSVATYLAVVGREAIIARLQRDPFFRDKRIVILSFAQSGFKQPQQVLILAHFLSLGQRLDAVVNVDGFNEAALALSENWERGVDISMPRSYPASVSQRFASPSDEHITWQAELVSLRRKRARVAALIHRSPSAAASLLLKQLDRMHAGRIQTMIVGSAGRFPDASAGFVTGTVQRGPKEEVVKQIVTLWSDGSRAMSRLAAAYGIHYVHILQPNQFYTNRTFTPAERKVAFNEPVPSPYAAGIRLIYPLMVRELAKLRSSGVRAANGLGVLDSEAAPVYMDACCHYTRKGNEILGTFLADALISAVRE